MRISAFSKLGNYFMHTDNMRDKQSRLSASMCASAYVYAHAGLSNTRVMCACTRKPQIRTEMRKFRKHRPPKSLQPNPKPKPNSSKSLSETATIKGDLIAKPKPTPFVHYQTYIKSKEWFAWRKFIIEWRGKKCQLCMREDKLLELHHMTYKRIGKEDPRDVLVVCITCHKFIHKEHEHWK